MINLIENRELIGKIRGIVRKIPGLWSLYWLYWYIRKFFETKQSFTKNKSVLDFGDYPLPNLNSLATQLCTANQFNEKQYSSICRLIGSPPRFSRKQWEFVYIINALELSGMLKDGYSGIGFGCGREPLAGFFASKDCRVLATDLSIDEARDKGWVSTLQHADGMKDLYTSSKYICEKDKFYGNVCFENMDMNNISDHTKGKFDFTWSACALEHLGSLQHGLEFIRNSLDCLKPGGIAVHTTEFNLSSDSKTMETPSCSVYRKSDILPFIEKLEAEGFIVSPLNLNTGELSVDQYIDLPPYKFSPHLKLMLEQYIVTSIGIAIQKPL